jgi:hypothetical protein
MRLKIVKILKNWNFNKKLSIFIIRSLNSFLPPSC